MFSIAFSANRSAERSQHRDSRRRSRREGGVQRNPRSFRFPLERLALYFFLLSETLPL
jgi:hypothetical protein